jgi:hypothetical protein
MGHAKTRGVCEEPSFTEKAKSCNTAEYFGYSKTSSPCKYKLFFKIRNSKSWHFETPLRSKIDYFSSGKLAANRRLPKFR